MSKYTPEQLNAMAVAFFRSREEGGIQAAILLHILSHYTGFTIEECETKIAELLIHESE